MSRWALFAIAVLTLILSAMWAHGDGDLRTQDADLRAPYADGFDALFRKHGGAHGVDWRLLKATCEVESHLNPRAEHPGGLSAGLCQIHCDPQGRACRNHFNIAGWPPASREQLYEPDYNVSLAAQILGWNIRTYGLARGVAVYNQWSARRTPKSKPFPNQFYVDRVLRRYRELQQAAR